jgi:alcohol dehydrogenase YqhD (iron-dependent ADH family)
MRGWLWENPTRVAAGVNCVQTELPRFVPPGSRVAIIYDERSVAGNTAKADLDTALSTLKCEVHWEEGVRASPEYGDLLKSLPRIREFAPDFLIAIGGGSTIDTAKVLSWAIRLGEGEKPERYIHRGVYPSSPISLGVIVTLPASGSWWNPIFALYRRSSKETLSGESVYPSFALLDPRYPMSLPVRQLRNSVCDAIIHCIDQFVTGDESPLFDMYWIATMNELFDIGLKIVKDPPDIQLHQRLLTVSSMALNYLFVIGKDPCWAIHFIGCQLTPIFGVDHAVAVTLIAPVLLEAKFNSRKVMMAKAAEFIFGQTEGTVEEKGQFFIDGLRAFMTEVGMPPRLSEIDGVDLSSTTVRSVTKMVMHHMGNQRFGWNGEITEKAVEKILKAVMI